ncbi:MAG: hypothetical protein A2Z96_01510 [Spirochaetes bacterium GWB1_48_6]|nr:MAG: hypothetical protein A2Z96_01510 [Spirochaetes bacterium GWB1_48_6]
MSLFVSLIWGLIFWIYMFGILPFWIPYFLLKGLGLTKLTDGYFIWIHHLQCQLIVRSIGTTVVIHQLDKVPMDRPICYIGNHQGYADILVLLGWLPKIPGFIGKNSLLFVPVVNFWMLMNGSLFLDRKNLRKGMETIHRGAQRVKEGIPMVIFPEGGRNKGGPLRPFKRGAFKLAFLSEATIVPFSIRGTEDMLERTGRVQLFQRIDLLFHDPIPTAGLGKAAQEQVVEQVHGVILHGLEKIEDIRSTNNLTKIK